jgi:hypothetical protein
MADALASGASSRKGVRVQVPPRPPTILLSKLRQACRQLNPTKFWSKRLTQHFGEVGWAQRSGLALVSMRITSIQQTSDES